MMDLIDDEAPTALVRGLRGHPRDRGDERDE
jgi:hypothetical protein